MKKIVFAFPSEAIAALGRDKLALVTYSAGSVFVSTAAGMGTFSLADWKKAGGPLNSLTPVSMGEFDTGGPSAA